MYFISKTSLALSSCLIRQYFNLLFNSLFKAFYTSFVIQSFSVPSLYPFLYMSTQNQALVQCWTSSGLWCMMEALKHQGYAGYYCFYCSQQQQTNPAFTTVSPLSKRYSLATSGSFLSLPVRMARIQNDLI